VSEVQFIPKHLNQHPVVFRGMTMMEVAGVAGTSFLVGLVIGIVLAYMFEQLPLAPTVAFAAIPVGLVFGGRILERAKRNRPAAWFYRSIQYKFRKNNFAVFGGAELIVENQVFEIKRIKPKFRRR
jgi:conjugative transfer region protein (TIGR03750 family)